MYSRKCIRLFEGTDTILILGSPVLSLSDVFMQAFMGVLLSTRLAAIGCVKNEAKGRFVAVVVEKPPSTP